MLTEVKTSTLLVSEDFRRVPDWSVVSGASVGSRRGSVLTAGAKEGQWRVLIGAPATANVRISVQFRFTGPEGGNRSFDVGRSVDDQNAIFLSQHDVSQQTRLIKLLGGQRVDLAAGVFVPMRVGDWYWLELELSKGRAVGLVYHSDRESTAKADAVLRAVVTADVSEPIVPLGTAVLGQWLQSAGADSRALDATGRGVRRVAE